MLALLPHSSSPSTMLLGQELLYLLRNCADLEQFPSQIGKLLGQRWQQEICFVLVGQLGENPWQTVVWHQGNIHHLSFKTNFWEQGWVKHIQSHSVPFQLPPSPSKENNQNIQGKWKLNSMLSVASGLALCTRFQGKINGLVMIGSAQVRQWSPEEVQELIDFQDALAIANHLMMTSNPRSSPQAKHPYSDPVISSTTSRHLSKEENQIFKIWYDETRRQLEQQREWNEQLIHNIVTIMSDQTRNPLATIRMAIEMLRKSPPSPENLEQRLDIIEQEWRKLNEINEKILKLRTLKFDHNSLFFEPIDIIVFLEKFLKSEQTQTLLSLSNKQLKVETRWSKKTSILKIDIHCLEQILQELMINAEKFSEAKSCIQIEVKEIKEKNIFKKSRLEIYFRNYSRCISSKNLKYLFDPFYREQWTIDFPIQGIGLGLSIIKTLIEQLDGSISVNCKSTKNPDLCLISFVLAFPIENEVT